MIRYRLLCVAEIILSVAAAVFFMLQVTGLFEVDNTVATAGFTACFLLTFAVADARRIAGKIDMSSQVQRTEQSINSFLTWAAHEAAAPSTEEPKYPVQKGYSRPTYDTRIDDLSPEDLIWFVKNGATWVAEAVERRQAQREWDEREKKKLEEFETSRAVGETKRTFTGHPLAITIPEINPKVDLTKRKQGYGQSIDVTSQVMGLQGDVEAEHREGMDPVNRKISPAQLPPSDDFGCYI